MDGTRVSLLLIVAALAGLADASGFAVRGFSFGGVSNRLITPNGDGKNDDVAFQFSNPRDSSGTLKIYDLRGHELVSLPVGTGTSSVVWNARANGQIVPSGIYIYVLNVEQTVSSGSLVVVR